MFCISTADMLVELRESLWRLPMAFTQIVNTEEQKLIIKFELAKNLNIPKAFTREKLSNSGNRRSFLRPRSCIIIGKEIDADSKGKLQMENYPPHFRQTSNDPTQFSEDHAGVRISPMPTCHHISRKDLLWVSYKRMRDRVGGKEFNFLAQTFNLPQQRLELELCMEKEKGLWIIKPPGRNNGSGIRVIDNKGDLPGRDEETCVQKYIPNPYLILGVKFDIRVYVLVTSFDPLRIYVYDDGLVRLATEKYTLDPDQIHNARIHVTNYAVNKKSDQFIVNDSPSQAFGSKWTLSTFWQYLAETMQEGVDIYTIWARIQDLVTKSIFCGLESFRGEMVLGGKLEHKSDYNMYKLFGYDIMLDDHLQPHLIEINSRPAAHSDPLDAFVNRPMVREIFDIVGYHVPASALSTPTRKDIACKLLGMKVETTSSRLGYNPSIYSRTLDTEDIKKQNLYPRRCKEKSSYFPSILDKLTGVDIRVLVKTLEEYSKLQRFTRIFPTRCTSKYLSYTEHVSYYDKLLDAFVSEYGDFGAEGVHRVREACANNVHL